MLLSGSRLGRIPAGTTCCIWLWRRPQRRSRGCSPPMRARSDSISPFSTGDAGGRQARLRRADAPPSRRPIPSTPVILVVVENESGTWGAVRDYFAELRVAPSTRRCRHPSAMAMGQNALLGLERGLRQGRGRVLSCSGGGPLRRPGRRRRQAPSIRCRSTRTPRSGIRLCRDRPLSTRVFSVGPTDDVLPISKAAAPALDLLWRPTSTWTILLSTR